MNGNTLVKHKIKRVDRLLRNEKLNSEKFYIYKQLSCSLLKHLSEAIIIVDWTGCCSQQRWILQASLAMSGRSIPLYQEIHLLKNISSPKIERNFLYKLSTIVPKNIKVIIVTDAGFRTPWFRVVRELGWDFVGRLRGRVFLNFTNDSVKLSDFINKCPRYQHFGVMQSSAK